MLFNSIDFAFFLPIVFICYWFVTNKSIKFQNLLLIISSYIFYGWWNWRFLFLIILSTIIDYTVGIILSREDGKFKRKLLLWASITINLGILFLFKYYNFFVDSFITAFSLFGAKINGNHLNLILPIGISFYTFQTLSYSIDVYNRKLNPTKDLIAFAGFVTFFPQLIAGPIERATHLLPQFYAKRKFNYFSAADGMRQMLWGLFKKMVIADNCAKYANLIFNDSAHYSGSTLLMGALFFTFQIYGDFSGYSDIAIGTSRLFGFDLMPNFKFPYFSRDIAEFWRRWHISLSTWFRDYVYIPLGGNSVNKFTKVKNVLIVFIVSGIWHGANWTFIIWGLLNALYFLPLLLTGRNRNHIDIVAKGRLIPNIKELIQMLITFSLTVFAWIFFRSKDLSHAKIFITKMLSPSLFTIPEFDQILKSLPTIFFVGIFMLLEWMGRENDYAIATTLQHHSRPIRWGFYLTLVFIIFWFQGAKQEFIYFQF